MAKPDWTSMPAPRYEEGWGIYDTDLGPQVQAADEDGPQVFDTDEDAMRFIRGQAASGSAYHVAVLRWLRQNAPDEYAHMVSLRPVSEELAASDEAA